MTKYAKRIYKRTNGVAGQIAVDYAGGETKQDGWGEEYVTTPCGFVGSYFGDQVIYVGSSGAQMFVDSPDRFGSFRDDPIGWAKRFIGVEDGGSDE